jgi:spore maturation protein CgeB
MRLLCVTPGASYSTADVYNGMVPQLAKLGVEIHEYDLGTRLELAGRFLNMVWRQRIKNAPTSEKRAEVKANGYTAGDVVYKALIEILERALRFDVDGVLVFSGMFVAGDAFVLLKRAHVRTAVLLSESPYDSEKEMRILPWVDCAWTNERSSVPMLRTANPNVNYMPHAYDPQKHRPDADDPPDVPSHDVVFVGSLFAERVDLLSQVDWTGINFGLYGEWSGLPSRHKLRQYIAGDVVDNRYSAALYRKAKIGLNLYRESMGWGKDAPRITHAESMNPRTVELAACGCFQISQHRDEIAEVFGSSIPRFNEHVGLEGLIRYYLDHPEVRQVRAEQAMRAVQPHTFAARAQTILDDLSRAEWPV